MIKRFLCWLIITSFFMQMIGCYSSQTVQMSEIEAIEKADKVHIETKDGREYDLSYVKIEPPQIKGYYEEPYPYNQKPRKLIELKIEDIQSIEVKKVNYIVVVVGVGVGFVLIKVLVNRSNMFPASIDLGPM